MGHIPNRKTRRKNLDKKLLEHNEVCLMGNKQIREARRFQAPHARRRRGATYIVGRVVTAEDIALCQAKFWVFLGSDAKAELRGCPEFQALSNAWGDMHTFDEITYGDLFSMGSLHIAIKKKLRNGVSRNSWVAYSAQWKELRARAAEGLSTL